MGVGGNDNLQAEITLCLDEVIDGASVIVYFYAFK